MSGRLDQRPSLEREAMALYSRGHGDPVVRQLLAGRASGATIRSIMSRARYKLGLPARSTRASRAASGLRIEIDAPTMVLVVDEAHRRCMPPAVLLGRVIARVFGDAIVDAVIDDPALARNDVANHQEQQAA